MIRKISAFGLAAIIFITSTGFQLSAHYCSGSLKSFKLFGKAEVCEYEKIVVKPCHMHKEMATKTNCCDNEDIKLDPSTYEAVALAKVIVDHSFDFISPQHSIYEYAPHQSAHLDFITLYRPPPIDRDIPVMVQSFLL